MFMLMFVMLLNITQSGHINYIFSILLLHYLLLLLSFYPCSTYLSNAIVLGTSPIIINIRCNNYISIESLQATQITIGKGMINFDALQAINKTIINTSTSYQESHRAYENINIISWMEYVKLKSIKGGDSMSNSNFPQAIFNGLKYMLGEPSH